MATETVAIAALQRAHDLGVSFLDTACGYSNSQERTRKALEGRDCRVASKSGARAEQEAWERMKTELDSRTCRRYRYCEPCPNGVQIGRLLRGPSVVRRRGAARFRDWGSAQIIASASHCAECGICITKCPYQLPIPELVQEPLAFYQAHPELSRG
jgi:predicted aldo/keto reductase-like oxidoreductase